MKLIEINGKYGSVIGNYAKVDDDMYDYLNQFNWFIQKSGHRNYVCRQKTVNGKQEPIMMHREVLGLTDPKVYGDHINHDTLDNQKLNLRVATNSQNQANSQSFNGYKGVTKRVVSGYTYWEARCRKGATLLREYLKSEIDAEKEYNRMAIELHGDFAFLNKIQDA